MRALPLGWLHHLRLAALDGVHGLVGDALNQVDVGEVTFSETLQCHEVLLVGTKHGGAVLCVRGDGGGYVQNDQILRRCQ